MNENKNDTLRRTFSRDCLFDALIILLQEKKLDEISISSLVKTAGVSRSTFYRNYTDIYDVIHDFLLRHAVEAYPVKEFEETDLKSHLKTAFRFYKTYQQFFCKVVKSNNERLLFFMLDSLTHLLNGMFLPVVQKSGFMSKIEISALVGIVYMIVFDWIKDGMSEDIDLMANKTYEILLRFRRDISPAI